jgi:alpha-glucosidase
MPKYLMLILYMLLALLVKAQIQDHWSGKIFWKEDFSKGKLPDGWTIKILNDSSVSWECTNQPYPGSFGHDQQAPPIASNSGGYHMQYAPGVTVDKNYRKWEKAKIWPDGYFQTSSIDCSGKHSVVLKFKQNFMWNDWGKVREDGGLYVGVSNNGNNWQEFEVRDNVGSEGDCPNPADVEINITDVAAMQKNVFLRFYWRGIYAWYWMVDDIQVSEALDVDLAASALISHPVTGNHFTKKDIFQFNVVNLGAYEISRPFDCFFEIDNRLPVKVTIPFSKEKVLQIIDTVRVVFPPADLTDYGIHRIRFYTSIESDERKENDTLELQLFSKAYALGEVTGFSTVANEFIFDCHHAKVKINFYRDDIYRIQMSYNGEFTNPAGNDIVVNLPKGVVKVKYSDLGDYYLLNTNKVALRAYKNPLRFAMYKSDNSSLVWEEVQGLTYGQETVQYLTRGEKEYFFGGGMQNGRFSHRDKTIKLRIDWDWEDGGNPNPAPFFMSTNGYAALRNTYSPGEYSFNDTVKLQHSEPGFDCIYFAGETLKNLLDEYTLVSGRPFLPPRWALSMGDANCYNRGASKSKNSSGYKGTTPDVIPLIAEQYIANRMPRGWILPNDGYGCGYTKLDSVVKELGKRGFHTGLWTENGVDKIAREVGEYGSRLCKLDVAWIGNGYKFAIDGCKAAYDGIEKNSDARGFVWSVCGWAGTHRNSVVWSGDQSGSWNYIRWHIPTVIGSGLSALNCATGDIDGIFGGSEKTYTRDLQWKCFTPVLMSMSGWAPKDKQPYVYGEPYTSINRKFLSLKLQLTPYMYSLCEEAWQTGVPAVRGLVLEYPSDPVTWGTTTQYEFLLGKYFLVAPVYKDEERRDSIYFPAGAWFDYWDGIVYKGESTLNTYYAPLDKLPLFVKAGSIIPMYTVMNFDNERAADTLILDVFPGANAEFELYEDDGSTQEYRGGAYAITKLKMLSADTEKVTDVSISASLGTYKGKVEKRKYMVRIHHSSAPAIVSVMGNKLRKYDTKELFEKAEQGWFVDPNDQMKVLNIKTTRLSTYRDVAIKLVY